MQEEQARLEIHNRFAVHTEPEVSGLNDARVDRPHSDLVNAFAADLLKGKRLAVILEILRGCRILQQRVIIFRPELMQRQAA